MDYERYRLNWKERAQCLTMGLLLSAAFAWLFYRSAYGLLLFPAVCAVYTGGFRKERLRSRKEQLLSEFADAMRAVSGALLAGYSMENAWKEAQREVTKLHGEGAYMARELQQMNVAVGMNEPVERMLSEFAGRSGCEEIENFAEIFSFAKRSGGDFPKIIRSTVYKLAGSIDVEREIATVLAGKRFEGKIMNGMPLFILAYMNFASGEFLEALYGNLLGVLVMSGALAAYFGALKLSERILDIHV